MPIGDPPTKPADDASDADFEKYRHDFDVYVAEKLAQFAETEMNLKADQKTADERLRDLDGRERGILDQEKALATERDKMDAREILVSTGEEALKKDERAYTDKVNILKMQQAEAKVEEKRLKALKRELEERGVAGGATGLPPALTDILLQQKTLLEKQVRIEQEREAREKEEKEKRDKRVLIGKGIKPPIFRGDEGERPEAHLMRAKDWLEATDPTMTEAQKGAEF